MCVQQNRKPDYGKGEAQYKGDGLCAGCYTARRRATRAEELPPELMVCPGCDRYMIKTGYTKPDVGSQVVYLHARGICGSCYSRRQREGTLDEAVHTDH